LEKEAADLTLWLHIIRHSCLYLEREPWETIRETSKRARSVAYLHLSYMDGAYIWYLNMRLEEVRQEKIRRLTEEISHTTGSSYMKMVNT